MTYRYDQSASKVAMTCKPVPAKTAHKPRHAALPCSSNACTAGSSRFFERSVDATRETPMRMASSSVKIIFLDAHQAPPAATIKPTTAKRAARIFSNGISTSGEPPRYVYRWDRCGRKGQRCRVFARGTMNSVGLEFEDAFRMVSSGNALRRA